MRPLLALIVALASSAAAAEPPPAPPLTVEAVALSAKAFAPPASTAISFRARGAREGVVDLVDEEGRVVRSLAIKVDRSGRGRATWDGKDAAGQLLPPGVYRHFIRVSDGEGRKGQDDTAGKCSPKRFVSFQPEGTHFRRLRPRGGFKILFEY